jgi:hypothetical protein
MGAFDFYVSLFQRTFDSASVLDQPRSSPHFLNEASQVKAAAEAAAPQGTSKKTSLNPILLLL